MPFDPYYSWLGIPPNEQPPNHYRLLGLSQFEQNEEAISNAADRQMAHVKAFQTGAHGADSQRILNELALARNCLLDFEQRRSYDAHLRLRLSRSLSAVASLPVEIGTLDNSASIPLYATINAGCQPQPPEFPDTAPPDDSHPSDNDLVNTGTTRSPITRKQRIAVRSAVGQAAQIVGGGAVGIVLSLLLMEYVLGIDVQALFYLQWDSPPVVARQRHNGNEQRHPAPVERPANPQTQRTLPANPQIQPTRPTQVVKKAIASALRPAPSPLRPLPEPDTSTMRGLLQGEIRKPRLHTPSETELREARESADTILAQVRQEARSDPEVIAQHLIVHARGKEPALRYTLLMWAAEAARSAGKFQLMCDVIDELAREQLVDALSTKAKLLIEGESSISELGDASAFVDVATVVIDQALLRFDHSSAHELTAAVIKVGDRIDDPSLREKCSQLKEKVERRTGLATPAAPLPQAPEQKFTGLFHRNGDRGESFADRDGNVTELSKQNLYTITGWGQQALTAKSSADRYAAMDTLMCIARNHTSGDSRLTEPEISELRIPVDDLLRSNDGNARAIAVAMLAFLPVRPGDLIVLVNCLKDRDQQVRLAAGESLGKVADGTCVNPLMIAMRARSTHLPDDPRAMKLLIVRALGHVSTKSAANALRTLLSEESDRAILQAIQGELDRLISEGVADFELPEVVQRK